MRMRGLELIRELINSRIKLDFWRDDVIVIIGRSMEVQINGMD